MRRHSFAHLSRAGTSARFLMLCIVILLAVTALPASATFDPVAVAQPRSVKTAMNCAAIKADIASLQKDRQSWLDKMNDPNATLAERQFYISMIKQDDAAITADQAKLAQCLALASPGGGEPFTMQGGVFLSAGEVAAGSAISQANCPPDPAGSQPSQTPSSTASPLPTASWMAASCHKGNPSDAQVAASATQVVVTFENSLAWYSKQGSKQGELTSFALFQPLLQTLGAHVGTASDASNDCLNPASLECARTQSDFRVLFDEYRQVFWVVDGAGYYPAEPGAATRTPAKARGLLLVAVSVDQDPKDGWYLYWMDCVAHWGKANDNIYKPGDGGDYPSIGIDPFGFHVTNAVGNSGQYRYWHVAFFQANDPGHKVLHGIPPSGWHYYDLQDPDGGATSLIQPVVHHGPTGRAYYVSRYLADEVLVWALTDPLGPNQDLQRAEVKLVNSAGQSVPFNPPLDAPELGGASPIEMTNLRTGSSNDIGKRTDIAKAVYRGGELALVAMDAQDWFGDGQSLTSIRVVRFFVLSYPNIPTQGSPGYVNRRFGMNAWDDKSPQDHMYYGWPAVEMNKHLDMVVPYVRSGSTIYPEVRYSVYFASEADIRPSRLLKNGESTYSKAGCPSPAPCRWADTTGAALDPVDDGIWVAQQYANAHGGWDMWVGKVFGSSPRAFLPALLSNQ